MSTINNFSNLMSEIKDLVELQAFAEQQHKTIVKLSKEIDEANRKVQHLEGLLKNISPEVGSSALSLSTDPEEKQIAEVQLGRLNEVSKVRELTHEEAKKVELYSKILQTFHEKKQKVITADSIETKSTADLLRLVEPNGN